jgi:hypothetical protein
MLCLPLKVVHIAKSDFTVEFGKESGGSHSKKIKVLTLKMSRLLTNCLLKQEVRRGFIGRPFVDQEWPTKGQEIVKNSMHLQAQLEALSASYCALSC